jgi:hypothetical protein
MNSFKLKQIEKVDPAAPNTDNELVTEGTLNEEQIK